MKKSITEYAENSEILYSVKSENSEILFSTHMELSSKSIIFVLKTSRSVN